MMLKCFVVKKNTEIDEALMLGKIEGKRKRGQQRTLLR